MPDFEKWMLSSPILDEQQQVGRSAYSSSFVQNWLKNDTTDVNYVISLIKFICESFCVRLLSSTYPLIFFKSKSLTSNGFISSDHLIRFPLTMRHSLSAFVFSNTTVKKTYRKRQGNLDNWWKLNHKSNLYSRPCSPPEAETNSCFDIFLFYWVIAIYCILFPW